MGSEGIDGRRCQQCGAPLIRHLDPRGVLERLSAWRKRRFCANHSCYRAYMAEHPAERPAKARTCECGACRCCRQRVWRLERLNPSLRVPAKVSDEDMDRLALDWLQERGL